MYADARVHDFLTACQAAAEGACEEALFLLGRMSLRGMRFAPEARCLMIRCAVETGSSEWALSLCHSFHMWLRDSSRRRTDRVPPYLAFVRACSGLIRQPGEGRLAAICAEPQIRERSWLIACTRRREFP